MLGFLCILALTETASYTMALSITCLLTGLVCTSRLIVSNHRPIEVYTGIFTGILAILTAWAVNSLSS
jgi:membrane-associated phospholipid phosphatase